jgi:hypothetical protein
VPALATPPGGNVDAELLGCAERALAAWNAYEALSIKWSIVVHIPEEVEREQKRLCDVADELREKAMRFPARTRAGLKAKARLTLTTLELRNDDSLKSGEEGFEAWSLCQDVLAEGM